MSPEDELARLKNSARILLSFDVYNALDRIADQGCSMQAVLPGPACRPDADSRVCPGCTAKALMQRMRDKLMKASWALQTGAEMIANERERQVEEEGYDSSHDDEHTQGQIAMAAACYAAGGLPGGIFVKLEGVNKVTFEDPWPWSRRHDKRGKHERIDELAKAGAFCAAEIDRLKRKTFRERYERAKMEKKLAGVDNG